VPANISLSSVHIPYTNFKLYLVYHTWFFALIPRLDFYFLGLTLRFLKHLYLAHKTVSVLLPVLVLFFLIWLSNLHLISHKPFIMPSVHYRTQNDRIMYFYKLNVKHWELDGSVSIVNKLWVTDRGTVIRYPGETRVVSFPKHCDQVWGLSTLTLNAYQFFLPE